MSHFNMLRWSAMPARLKHLLYIVTNMGLDSRYIKKLYSFYYQLLYRLFTQKVLEKLYENHCQIIPIIRYEGYFFIERELCCSNMKVQFVAVGQITMSPNSGHNLELKHIRLQGADNATKQFCSTTLPFRWLQASRYRDKVSLRYAG